MPKVSVVISTCNRASFLAAAVESVLRQTFQDFEVIVVDDASRDRTAEVIESFTDARIRYIRHDINKGQGVTRNAGIKHASGEYIALLDDDDEWLPEKLEKQVRLLESRPDDVGMVYTGFRKIDASTGKVIAEVIPEKRGYIFREMCMRNWIGTCSTVLVRRSCLEAAGWFDEGLASGADYDLWLRISRDFEIACIREPLVLYAVHDGSISTSYEARIRGIEGQLRKHAVWFANDSKNYSRRYFYLGMLYCCKGDLLKGRQAFLKAIQLYPYEIRHYYYLCLSLLGADSFRRFKHFNETHILSAS